MPKRTPDDRLDAAIDRILRTWSMIKMVPEHQLATLRPLLVEQLSQSQHLNENDLVVRGLKFLHQGRQEMR